MVDDGLLEELSELRHGLIAIGHTIEDIGVRDRRSTITRLSLLHVHALMGIGNGLSFAANGHSGVAGPSYAGLRWIPGFPYSWGALLAVCGVVLGVATVRRSLGWEMVGVAVMACWYGLFTAGFAYAGVRWHFHPAGPRPGYQVVSNYGGLTLMLTVHLMMLAWVRGRFGRSPAGGRS